MANVKQTLSDFCNEIAKALQGKLGTKDKLKPVNYATSIASLGGSCSKGHVIEVSELPTENIDEKAIYSCGDKYYKYSLVFEDIILVFDSTPFRISWIGSELNIACSFDIIQTKTSEGIIESDVDTSFHFYYIKDEDSVFIYTSSDGWLSVDEELDELKKGGLITDISQATEEEGYYVLVSEWKPYAFVHGELSISENGTYDVTNITSAIVNLDIPNYIVVQSMSDLPRDAQAGSLAIVLGGFENE